MPRGYSVPDVGYEPKIINDSRPENPPRTSGGSQKVLQQGEEGVAPCSG